MWPHPAIGRHAFEERLGVLVFLNRDRIPLSTPLSTPFSIPSALLGREKPSQEALPHGERLASLRGWVGVGWALGRGTGGGRGGAKGGGKGGGKGGVQGKT